MEDRFITHTEIASLLQLNPAHVRDRLTKRKDFPRPSFSAARAAGSTARSRTGSMAGARLPMAGARLNPASWRYPRQTLGNRS